jgi:hypothetical protein
MRLAHNSTDGALEGFLQTQYYSCKTSILLAGDLSGNGIWGSGRRPFGLLLEVHSSMSRKSATIFGQGAIPEPSTLHIGREVALVARTAAFVYI